MNFMKKSWFQQKSRSVSRDLYMVFEPSLGNLKLQSFIIVGFVWQILDGGLGGGGGVGVLPAVSVSSPKKAHPE